MLLKRPRKSARKRIAVKFPIILQDVQKKPKTIIIYVIAGLCVAAVFCLVCYIPYFHKPKQIAQPVVAQAPVTCRRLMSLPHWKHRSQTSYPAKTLPVLQNLSKNLCLSDDKSNKKPAGAKTRIAQVQKIAISPPVERKTRVAGTAGKEDMKNEPVRAVEKKTRR